MVSRAAAFHHGGIDFWYAEKGEGFAYVFQHGLGGDRRQPLELYAYQPGIRLLALDSRGHGKTRPLGDPNLLRFDVLADDVVALLDYLEIAVCVAGGISMGAGVALDLTLRHPHRVAGLVLVRPAWLAQPAPPNLAGMVEVGKWIRDFGVRQGKQGFLASPLYAQLAAEAPYTAESLLAQFDEPRAAGAWPRLLHLPADAPNLDPAAWRKVAVPTLVLGNHLDFAHPFAYAETLAGAIPGARLAEIPAKSVDRQGHVSAARAEIAGFLRQFVGAGYSSSSARL